MAITRTPMIDDDGSQTTGTIINAAWKTELYNQIDQADAALSAGIVGVPTTWVPADASGAGITFAAGTRGDYLQIGPYLFFYARVLWTGNSSGAGAVVGGLPFVNSGLTFAGAFATLAPLVVQCHLPVNGAAITLFQGNGAVLTNAMLSGAQIIMQGFYHRQ